MRIARSLAACSILLSGCSVVGSPAAVMDQVAGAQIARPSAEPLPPSPSPTPSPLPALKTYEDFAFKFSYPQEWQAKDMDLGLFALAVGARLAPDAAGKASILSDPSGNGRVSMVLFQGKPGSLIYDDQAARPVARSPETEQIIGATKVLVTSMQTFQDGEAINAVVIKAPVSETQIYQVLFMGKPGVTFDEIGKTADIITGSWFWK